MNQPGGGRRNIFLLLCAGCALAIVIYGIVAARRSRPASNPAAVEPAAVIPAVPSQPEATADIAKAAPQESSPSGKKSGQAVAKTVEPSPVPKAQRSSDLLYFETNALGEHYGKLSVAALDSLDRPRYSADVSCDRVHFSNGRGVCLNSDRGVFTTHYAVMFDAQMRRGWTLKLNGFPSRVRLSPSGHLAAITVFLTGQSYASLAFSTQTTIVDVDRGEVLADLETFSVTRNGMPFQSPDFNFWGVTFTHDENRFYATLWSKGQTYLVECDFAKRSAKVIYDGVECPSLSPDNMRIAFKKKTGGITWRISLLELKTLAERPLGETRSVDDQVEWLDNEHILYALSESQTGSSASTDIWALPVSANGSPELFLKGAFSPTVVPGKK